jgi:hypothetical protein
MDLMTTMADVKAFAATPVGTFTSAELLLPPVLTH